MHTFEGKTIRVHVNSDGSGDAIISTDAIREALDPGEIGTPPDPFPVKGDDLVSKRPARITHIAEFTQEGLYWALRHAKPSWLWEERDAEILFAAADPATRKTMSMAAVVVRFREKS